MPGWRELAREEVRPQAQGQGRSRPLLLLAACVSVFTTLASSTSWSRNRVLFFSHVPLWDFLTDTQWTPLFDDAHFGIMPCCCRARSAARWWRWLVAIPLGHDHRDLSVANSPATATREIAQAGAGTALRRSDDRLRLLRAAVRDAAAAEDLSRRCLASTCSPPGIVMGIMIIPYVASLSRGRDARGADEPARRRLRHGRDAFPDRDSGGRAGGAFRASRRPTSSASRARSAKR